MNNPFRRKVTHVALVDNDVEIGDPVTTLCGLTRSRQSVETGKRVRACGECYDRVLAMPVDELNDLLSRMHDMSLLVNRLAHPLNALIDFHEEIAEVLNRDGAASVYKKPRD